jgi:hypothetical protein
MSNHGPDAYRDVQINLTTEEIGNAFANRCDDDQAEILRVIVRNLDRANHCTSAQACAIGTRLFHEMRDRDTAGVVDFLRTILYSLNADAQKLVEASTVKEGA